MKTVGDTLRSAREEKNLDLVFISDTLKIRVKYLEALENGNYTIFSSPLYIKGFLKNYSKLLGLDENNILALYRREYTEEDNYKERLFIKTTPVINNIRFILKPNHIVSIFTFIIVVIIFTYLFFEYQVFYTSPLLKIKNPSQNEVVNSQTIIVKGTTNAGNKVSINGVSIPYIAASGDFSTEVNLHSGGNELTITSTNSLNRVTTVKRDLYYDDKSVGISSVAPSTGSITQKIPMSGRLLISNDNTWIKITTDDKIPIYGVLPPGTIKTFSAQSSVTIYTGMASDTNLSINGQNIALNGNGVIERTITLDSGGNIRIN